MLSDHGLHAEQVAFTASLLGIASVTGRFVLGALLDFVKGSLIAVASLLAAGVGMLCCWPTRGPLRPQLRRRL
jgi:predicted MFS family arabinose efflux permease